MKIIRMVRQVSLHHHQLNVLQDEIKTRKVFSMEMEVCIRIKMVQRMMLPFEQVHQMELQLKLIEMILEIQVDEQQVEQL